MSTINFTETQYPCENIRVNQFTDKFFDDKTLNRKRSARYGYSYQEKCIQKYGITNHLAYTVRTMD